MTTSILPPVMPTDIAAATGLTPHETGALFAAINATRLGLMRVTVAVTYKKVTDTPARKAGTDYVALPGVPCTSLTGTLVAAPTAKAGHVYLLIADRHRPTGTTPSGWTAMRLEGLKAFTVVGLEPGPNAPK
jgi:hypothetical protein